MCELLSRPSATSNARLQSALSGSADEEFGAQLHSTRRSPNLGDFSRPRRQPQCVTTLAEAHSKPNKRAAVMGAPAASCAQRPARQLEQGSSNRTFAPEQS